MKRRRYRLSKTAAEIDVRMVIAMRRVDGHFAVWDRRALARGWR